MRLDPYAGFLCGLCLLGLSCSPALAQAPAQASAAPLAPVTADSRQSRALAAAESAGLPANLKAGIVGDTENFIAALQAALDETAPDPYLLARVDKVTPLSADYAPSDLVQLSEQGIAVTRADHRLRRQAAQALARLSAAAEADGIRLSVGSAYRSYVYQESVYARWVSELGKAQADRVSAQPGKSQHQLGLALDFAPIDNAFATSPQGRWVAANAGRFGFSLSFPRGAEALTGYDWESWHWRYIGVNAVRLQAAYFGDSQHWMLVFIQAWRSTAP